MLIHIRYTSPTDGHLNPIDLEWVAPSDWDLDAILSCFEARFPEAKLIGYIPIRELSRPNPALDGIALPRLAGSSPTARRSGAPARQPRQPAHR